MPLISHLQCCLQIISQTAEQTRVTAVRGPSGQGPQRSGAPAVRGHSGQGPQRSGATACEDGLLHSCASWLSHSQGSFKYSQHMRPSIPEQQRIHLEDPCQSKQSQDSLRQLLTMWDKLVMQIGNPPDCLSTVSFSLCKVLQRMQHLRWDSTHDSHYLHDFQGFNDHNS